MVKLFECPNFDKYVLFTAPRPETLKAVDPKIGEVYGWCFGKREYSQLPKCLARAKVKWGTWKNGDHSSVKQTHIDGFSLGDGTEDGNDCWSSFL